MRSWGSRRDTLVVDEPLYAHYLSKTRREHPGMDEIIANGEVKWKAVVRQLNAPLPPGKQILYQKQMAHHLLEDMSVDWVDKMKNAFLIRDPRQMLRSLDLKLEGVTLADTGLPQQVRLFRRLNRGGGPTPPVIDSRDVLTAPKAILSALCGVLGVSFGEEMLSWSPGPRSTDGIWSTHWYAQVEKSEGFRPYTEKQGSVPEHLSGLLAQCMPLYNELYAHRLQ